MNLQSWKMDVWTMHVFANPVTYIATEQLNVFDDTCDHT